MNPWGAQSAEHTPYPSHNRSQVFNDLQDSASVSPGRGKAKLQQQREPETSSVLSILQGQNLSPFQWVFYSILVPSSGREQGISMTRILQGSGGSSNSSTWTNAQRGDAPRGPWAEPAFWKLLVQVFVRQLICSSHPPGTGAPVPPHGSPSAQQR